MIESGCPNCGGALFSESFKAEGRYFIEITCINCARQWTPTTTHEIIESFLSKGHLEKARRVDEELNEAIRRESRPLVR
jgi:hypothetical protein